MAARWTSYFLAALLISCLLSFGFNYRELFSSPKLFQNFRLEMSVEDISDEPGMSISLHPGRHTSRAPTILNLQWEITRGYRSPDGVRKLVYLINGTLSNISLLKFGADAFSGAFPGPTIEARSGDTLIIEVYNLLEREGLAFHWHGLHMRGKRNPSRDPLKLALIMFFKTRSKRNGRRSWHHSISYQSRR
jgi:FtsP/CotA-like multicopper oxidase with cupredoxin domain